MMHQSRGNMRSSPKCIVSFTTSNVFFSPGAVTNETSLFTYDSTHLLDEYYYAPKHDPSFVPVFSVAEDLEDPLLEPTLQMCSGEGAEFCKYDALITRSLEQGNATLISFRSHMSIKNALQSGECIHQKTVDKVVQKITINRILYLKKRRIVYMLFFTVQ